ncbi:hypothetical protein OG689_26520 [Kitasatospora sp. NBC_00240]|uniref:hypothetical protein n=1 Tax=Kitasatospora sp. NBC_00240 TaxID=2903567 RepID=UPI00224CAAFE|nr:hypothetical protein [Kitasatospora sp. NBC_00240]MCX5212792.1 hypothetical protein [Kitasatospora sp. NBC_00240]
MRAKHPTHPQAPATACRDGGRPGRGWLPRPRAVAAGGALLVQLWGVGLGAGCAQATTVTPGPAPAGAHRAAGPDSVPLPAQRRPQRAPDRTADQDASPPSRSAPVQGAGADAFADRSGDGRSGDDRSGDLVGQLTGTVPALDDPAAPVGRLLQERIRAGDLPLPGQGKAVPDAFAIAAVLLHAAPPEPREEDEPRASRDAPAEPAEPDTAPAAESAAPAEAQAPAVRPGAPAAVEVEAAADRMPLAAQQPGGGPPPAQALPRPGVGPGPDATAGSPVGVGTAGTSAAVLVPITAGLLLTGAAMYKHRGLPKGH